MGSIGSTINLKCEEPSGINVLIVGAGLGGLYAAIDFHRQGHAVVVVESKKEVEALGTFILFARTSWESPDRANRRFRWHRSVCNQAVSEMARDGRDVQQYHLSTINDPAHP